MLTFVVNALALVRLWWTLHTNLSCNLADLLLRNTLNGKVSVIRYLKGALALAIGLMIGYGILGKGQDPCP